MNKTIPLFALLLVGIVAVGAWAMPFGGFFGGKDAKQTPEMTAVQQAMDSGNFDAWKLATIAALTTRLNAMTQADFQKMVDQHKQMAQKRADMEAKMAPVKAAIEAGDYNAWKAAMTNLGNNMPGKMADKITEANFPKFVQMYKARESGDSATAKSLAAELGFKSSDEGKQGKHLGGRGHWGNHNDMENQQSSVVQ